MKINKAIISLFIFIILMGVFSACQSSSGVEIINPTQTQELAATSEPIHWATIAPMTTHTPTPTIPPLQSFPKGRIAFQSM
jgi:hypothetical protein